MSSTLVQFRANEEFMEWIDAYLKDPAIRSAGEDRSFFVRRSALIEAQLWKCSPYVSEKTSHYLFCSKDGTYFYRRLDRLRMNADIPLLPAAIEMKWEQVERFLIEASESPELVRQKWAMNRFSAWRSEDQTQALSLSDEKGLASKMVALPIQAKEGECIHRESCCVIKDYVQRVEAFEGTDGWNPYDRCDFEVDIPTRDIDVVVMVDPDLWADHTFEWERLFDPIRFEYRNREEVSFRGEARQLFDSSMTRVRSYYPKRKPHDEGYRKSISLVREGFFEMKERFQIHGFNEPITESGKLPENYFFYRISVPWVHLGLVLSVRWLRRP